MDTLTGNTPDSMELVSLGKNLAKLMRTKGVDTKELSTLTGISISLLNALKRGEGNPTLGTLITLSNFFNVSIGSLISPDAIKHEAVMVIPIYDIQSAHQENKQDTSQSYCLRIEGEPTSDQLFAVKLDNSSLMPFFDKGSIFILSKEKKYTDGDIVLVRINEEYNVFRRVFVKNQGLLFQYISLEAELQSYDHYKILGTTIKVVMNMGM